MQTNTDVERFLKAQNAPLDGYDTALKEIKAGKKTSHWIWYISPQLRCLGHSHRANYYGIAGRAEAEQYLKHPLLASRLREITAALLMHKDLTAVSILGGIDAQKVCSCMTMFDILSPNDIFGEVLQTFYAAKRCELTLQVMQECFAASVDE